MSIAFFSSAQNLIRGQFLQMGLEVWDCCQHCAVWQNITPSFCTVCHWHKCQIKPNIYTRLISPEEHTQNRSAVKIRYNNNKQSDIICRQRLLFYLSLSQIYYKRNIWFPSKIFPGIFSLFCSVTDSWIMEIPVNNFQDMFTATSFWNNLFYYPVKPEIYEENIQVNDISFQWNIVSKYRKRFDYCKEIKIDFMQAT